MVVPFVGFVGGWTRNYSADALFLAARQRQAWPRFPPFSVLLFILVGGPAVEATARRP